MTTRDILRVTVNYEGSATPETFFLAVDKQSFDSLNDAARTELVSTHLRTVALSKQMSIKTLIVAYSFAEDVGALLARHNYGDTVVEATLPYCLHLPNGHKTIVKLSDDRTARILLEKVWTDRAEGSDATDIFHDAKVTYFQKSEYRTPEVPRDPKLGWEFRFAGKNIERERDIDGTYRYTRAWIEFDTKTTPGSRDPGEILRDCSAIALEAMNRFLDAYRYVTSTDYIERVSVLNVTEIPVSETECRLLPHRLIDGNRERGDESISARDRKDRFNRERRRTAAGF